LIVLGMARLGSRDRAAEALAPIAASLNLTVEETACRIFQETCTQIADHVRECIGEANDRPVYTIHELLEGRQVRPRVLFVVGGPAPPMAEQLGALLECEPKLPPHAEVANAIGAALARTTAEITLLADTEEGILTITEEGLRLAIPPHFTMADAIRIGGERLRERVLRMGAADEGVEIDVVEAQQFNMVRDYATAGKNIRVRVQIKPGAITGLSPGEIRC
jgi:hypothetical protein